MPVEVRGPRPSTSLAMMREEVERERRSNGEGCASQRSMRSEVLETRQAAMRPIEVMRG